MSDIGPILGLSALLACLLGVGATTLHGLLTGRLYREPSCPPIVFRERPAEFLLLLATYLILCGFLILGCVKVGRLLF